jgi:hypothetical protein
MTKGEFDDGGGDLFSRPDANGGGSADDPGGWAFMLGAWAGIISLAVFRFSKVLRNGRKKISGGADRAGKTSGAVG